MNLITREEVLQALIDAHPPFKKRFEEDKDSYYSDGDVLLYAVASDIADEVVDLSKRNDGPALKSIFNFIETLLEKGDDYVKELATVGFLEDIQNHAEWAEMDRTKLIPYLGINSQKAWDDLDNFWSGRAPLVGVSWEELAKACLADKGIDNPTELELKEEIVKLMKDQKRTMQGGLWVRIVNFFNTPIKRYGFDGKELVDPSPRIPMIWSIPIILGGSVLVFFLLLIYFAFVVQ